MEGKTKRLRGGQAGNSNNLKHGYYALITVLKKGHLDRRTLLGRFQLEQERELAAALGGDPSPQEQVLIRDVVRCLLYLGSIDSYLIGLKSAIRRGKLHPIIIERVKLAAHIRETLKALGLKRQVKPLSLSDYFSDDGGEASENGQGSTSGIEARGEQGPQ